MNKSKKHKDNVEVVAICKNYDAYKAGYLEGKKDIKEQIRRLLNTEKDTSKILMELDEILK